ncbi:MAG: sugar transporter [Cyclobacteriaceae bacterium]|nr:MAG: sugar transporter [Cyclobacteriaceae bacterium]
MKKWQLSNEEEIISEDVQEFDYFKFINKLLDRWYIILFSLSIACLIAFLANRYITPIYSVNASLLVKAEKEIANPISDLFYGDEFFGRNSTNIENETSLIESYRLIENTLRDLNLGISYFKEGQVRNEELYVRSPIKFTLLSTENAPYEVLFKCTIKNDTLYSLESVEETTFIVDKLRKLGIESEKTISIKQDQLVFGQPVNLNGFQFAIDFVADTSKKFQKEVLLKIHDYTSLAKLYRKELTVAPKSTESSIINLALEGPMPQKVIDFLDRLMENYIESELSQKNFTAQRTIEFIENQIGFTGDSLRSVEARMESFKQSSTPVGLSQEGSQLSKSLESFEDQRLKMNLTIRYLDDQKNFLLNNNYEQLISPSSLGIDDDNLNALIRELITSHSEMRLMESDGNRNPLVRLKMERMENLKVSVLENILSLLATYRFRVETLDSQIAAVRSSMRRLPTAERELIDMQRTQTLNEELYIFLMQKKFEAGIAKSSNTPDYRIVNEATIQGMVPVRPSPILNYAVAIFLGLTLPSVFILLYDFLDNKVNSKSDLLRLTSVPLLGEIPRNSLDQTQTLVASVSPRSGIAESFRNVRSNLRYLKNGQLQGEIFLVTSSISGEGKSFCSANLAFVFSNFGKKVLLVNADMRKKSTYQEFGIKENFGLSDYLAGLAEMSEVIHASMFENLHILPAGKIPPNPSELLISGKFETLLNELKKEFDYIILDTPPVGILSDGLEIMRLTDINIYVVRQGYTFKKELEGVDQIYRDINKKFAILLNDVKIPHRKYGYGYYEEDQAKSKLKTVLGKIHSAWSN